MTRFFLASIFTLFVFSGAEARSRAVHAHPDCNVLWPCAGVETSARGQRVVKAMGGFGAARKVYKREAKVSYRHIVRERKRPVVGPVIEMVRAPIAAVARTVSGIVAPLAAKVAEIQSTCGSRVISAVRHTRVAGTRIMSLHASGHAVDIVGNPSCIYAQLSNWAGGYSIDYSRVAHVHISWGGREHGVRFAHGDYKRYTKRHTHRRYANAQ